MFASLPLSIGGALLTDVAILRSRKPADREHYGASSEVRWGSLLRKVHLLKPFKPPRGRCLTHGFGLPCSLRLASSNLRLVALSPLPEKDCGLDAPNPVA